MKVPPQQRLHTTGAGAGGPVGQVSDRRPPEGPAHRQPLAQDVLVQEPDPLLQNTKQGRSPGGSGSCSLIWVAVFWQRGKRIRQGPEPGPFLQHGEIRGHVGTSASVPQHDGYICCFCSSLPVQNYNFNHLKKERL